MELENVSRSFVARRDSPTQALRGVSLRIGRGEIFGVLGPNGAGKTTLVRILSTLLTPSSGSARVLGLDVVRDARQVRRSIGVVFGGERGLYDRLSARDNLAFAAQLYGVPRAVSRRRIAQVLELVGLTDRAASRVETYSRGMKQRLHIARALIHDPDILFLDEPSAGLDPVAARGLRDLVRGLSSDGKTILLTTHYMFEADDLCNRVAVLAAGEVVIEGSPEDVKSAVKLGRVIEIEVYGGVEDPSARIRRLPGVSGVEVQHSGGPDRLIVRVVDGCHLALAEIVHELGGLRTGALIDRGPTLEDAYIALVQKSAT